MADGPLQSVRPTCTEIFCQGFRLSLSETIFKNLLLGQRVQSVDRL